MDSNIEKILKVRYCREGESTWEDVIKRVSCALACNDSERMIFEELMRDKLFIPNSPTLSNAGVEGGQLSACFVLPVGDDIDEIFDALKYMAKIHKSGGGTGFSFSNLREEGASVKTTRGIASGPLSFMRIFDAATEEIKQGGRRRGANMGVLDVSHPDIENFILSKLRGGFKNFNFSVMVTDDFMRAVESDIEWELRSIVDETIIKVLKARKIWNLMVDSAWKCGDPGILFKDEINRKHTLSSVSSIEATNPCVTGDTLVAVADGRNAVTIKQLAKEGKDVPVFCKDDKGKIKVRMMRNPRLTGKKKRILKIYLDNGDFIRCTENHKFILSDGSIKEAKSLVKSDSLSIMTKRIAPFEKVIEGSNSKSNNYCWINNTFEKEWVLEHRLIANHYFKERTRKNVSWENHVVHHKDYKGFKKKALKKLKECQSKTNLECYLDKDSVMVRKMCEGCGKKFDISWTKREVCFCSHKCYKSNYKDSFEIRKKANGKLNKTCFERGRIKRDKQVKVFLDFRKELGRVPFKSEWEKKCESEGVSNRLRTKYGFWNYGELKEFALTHNHRVDSIEFDGYEDVYNGTVDDFHNFYIGNFDGDLDGSYCYVNVLQCGEQPLMFYESCNLGSMNLVKCVENGKFDFELLKEITKKSVLFLNRVIDNNCYPLPQIKDISSKTRKIGLGVMGLADALILLKIKYGSMESLGIINDIFKTIAETGWTSSRNLVDDEIYSEPFLLHDSMEKKLSFQRLGAINSTITTIAPTGTISIVVGVSSGIEPLFKVKYKRKDSFGERDVVHPLFEKINYSKYKKYVVTAEELDAVDHLKVQSTIQKWIDNAVSKTINLPFDATVEDVNDIYINAWKMGCKGVTVFRRGSKQGVLS